jgi:hypothetical protein
MSPDKASFEKGKRKKIKRLKNKDLILLSLSLTEGEHEKSRKGILPAYL